MSVAARLKARGRELKADVFALYLVARHPSTPWYATLFVVAIVAYALSPIDLIPDFIPVLGLLDEIVLLPFAIVLAVKMVPGGVMGRVQGPRLRASSRWFARGAGGNSLDHHPVGRPDRGCGAVVPALKRNVDLTPFYCSRGLGSYMGWRLAAGH